MDHVDAINQIFAEFEFAYHNQFHKAFAEAEALVIAKKYWLSSLERYSPRQIVAAAKHVIQSQDYLPSIAAFIRACEEGKDLFGLPATRQAYVEACSAPSPKKAFAWSHEAVYYAGKAAGWYLLANESEATAYPLFEYHYEQLCRRVVNGEELAIVAPKALAEKVERKIDKKEAKTRIARLKKELGL
ncbi:MAG: replication protein P [Gammaproteobacteria bacterium]|nr:replication protein P [Gammaproteobacteria bacterium]MDD9896783.1 replication protein P [Gammaproteobacteria bacterium]MDD9960412.1 replication protein P [Gammaproteobacteria bacterium]